MAQSPEAARLIEQAVAKSGAKNAPQLADALGYDKRNEDGKVRRWLEGRNDPSFDATMRLLRYLDLLCDESGERAAPNGNGSTRDDALAAMQADVRTLLQSVEQMLSRLEGFAGPDAARWLSDGQAAEGSPESPPAQQR